MNHDHRNHEAGSATATDSLSPRRDFLKQCGRYAAVTPPLVTLLLSTAGPNYLLAASGRAAVPDVDEAGTAEGRVAAPRQQPVQPIAMPRIEPIGSSKTAARSAWRAGCRGSFF